MVVRRTDITGLGVLGGLSYSFRFIRPPCLCATCYGYTELTIDGDQVPYIIIT